MALTGLNFTAQVSEWTAKSNDRMLRVFREASQDVIQNMQKPVAEGGHMPIITGFLRASLRVSVNGAPVLPSRSNPGQSVAYNPAYAALAIKGANIGDTIYAAYGAVYAPHVEQRRAFVRLAAQSWPALVAGVELRLRLGSQTAGN